MMSNPFDNQIFFGAWRPSAGYNSGIKLVPVLSDYRQPFMRRSGSFVVAMPLPMTHAQQLRHATRLNTVSSATLLGAE
jgi:hypothetical protein